MTLLVIILVTFIAGVFVGALITGSKDRPLKTPMIEDFEIHWTKKDVV